MRWGRSMGIVTCTLWIGLALLGCGSAAPADTTASGGDLNARPGGSAPGNTSTSTGGQDTDYLTLVDGAEDDGGGDNGGGDNGGGGDKPDGGGAVITETPVDPVDGVGKPAADETGTDDESGTDAVSSDTEGDTTASGGSSGGDVGDAVTVDEGATAAQVLAVLAAMPPLPKPHHYAPSVFASMPVWRDFTPEIVRITRSSGIAANYDEGGARLAVQAAIAANQAEPGAIPTTLNMYWVPWLQEYNQQNHAVTDFGAQYLQGLARLQQFINNQRAWIDQANLDFGSNIQVGHFALELELWEIPSGGDAVFEAALLRRHNECYDMVKAVFPEAMITWFDRGGVHRGTLGNGLGAFDESPRFTHLERGDACSTMLYTLMDGQDGMLEAMRRTIVNVDELYGTNVPIVPFIALGAGYAHTMTIPTHMSWKRTWDYRPVHSYHMGMFINRPEFTEVLGNVQWGADWSRVPAVFFYPELIDHKPTTAQVLNIRLKHFIAYCCGATNTPFPRALWPETD